MAAPARPRPADVVASGGILMGVAAYSLFAFHDAIVKAIIHELPVTQIMLVRSTGILLGVLLLGRGKLLRQAVASRRKPMIFFRAVATLAAWCLYYFAGRFLQLAEMTTLYYLAPVITMVLAVVFLGERFTLPRTAAAAIGFAGVVIATNPLGLSFGWPSLMVLSAAALWSVATILMRTISRSESTLVQITLMNLTYVVILVGFVLFTWQPMDARQIGFCLAASVVGGVAQFMLVEAARRVPAGVLGTIEYSALAWAFVLGTLFWHELPSTTIYLGAAFVTAAGLTLAWGERRAANLSVR